MTPDPAAPDDTERETERAWLIARAWAHLDYREVIAIRGIAPDLARMLEGLCSMYAIRIGGEGQTTYTRIRGAEERPMSPHDAADQLSREEQEMRLDEATGLPATMLEPTSFDAEDERLEPSKIGDEGCTCTLPPSYEGPCSWCDIHGQPSVAFEQGVAEGENSGRVFERELRDLRTKFAAMRRDRDQLSAGLRKMARRYNSARRSYIESARRTLVARAELKAHRELAEQGWGRPSVRVMEENAQLRADLESSRQTRQELADQMRIASSGAFRRAAEVARLTAELAELRAGRDAGATEGSSLFEIDTLLLELLRSAGRQWGMLGVARAAAKLAAPGPRPGPSLAFPSDSTPADRGPLTPHPPPWPVSIDGVLTSQKPGQNFDIPCARCGFDRHWHTVNDGACRTFEEGDDA